MHQTNIHKSRSKGLYFMLVVIACRFGGKHFGLVGVNSVLRANDVNYSISTDEKLLNTATSQELRKAAATCV